MTVIVGIIKRNPVKSATALAALVSIFIGVPGIVASAHFLNEAFEPQTPATHSWVRAWGQPIILTQNAQAVAIDRFLLFQQQQALDKALKDPGAGSSPIVNRQIENLKDQINDTKNRISNSERGHR